jgi:hypothetical protein
MKRACFFFVTMVVPHWGPLIYEKVPAPTREGPGGGYHHFAPDGEDTFEYKNYHSPYHIH